MTPQTFDLLVLALLAWVYFIPTCVAVHRRHPQRVAIFVLNLLLGFTGFGWAIALVWARTAGRVQAEEACRRGWEAYNRQDYATALREWQPLAQQGDATWQNYLGFMYREGLGVAQNDAEAVQWFQKAAAQSNALGQINLGVMYSWGLGVAQNDAEAVKWFQKAAAQSNALGQYHLGTMYEQGRGIRQDLVAAQHWFAQAAEALPPGIDRNNAIQARDRLALLPAEDIPLIKKGGVYEIPVEVNGVITLNFVLDTGASEVNTPTDVVSTLYRTGTIKDADFLPGQTYRLADGSQVNSSRFVLRSLKIGQRRITNVAASIGNISSPLLLGQSFLEKLGAWGIDNKRNILTINPDSTY